AQIAGLLVDLAEGDVEFIAPVKDTGIEQDHTEKQDRAKRQHDLHGGNKAAVARFRRASGKARLRARDGWPGAARRSCLSGAGPFVAGTLAHLLLLHFAAVLKGAAHAPRSCVSMRGSSIMR